MHLKWAFDCQYTSIFVFSFALSSCLNARDVHSQRSITILSDLNVQSKAEWVIIFSGNRYCLNCIHWTLVSKVIDFYRFCYTHSQNHTFARESMGHNSFTLLFVCNVTLRMLCNWKINTIFVVFLSFSLSILWFGSAWFWFNNRDEPTTATTQLEWWRRQRRSSSISDVLRLLDIVGSDRNVYCSQWCR